MTTHGLVQRFRRWRFAWRGVHADRSCTIGPSVSLGPWPRTHPPGAVVIGPMCELGAGVELNPWGGSIVLAQRVFLGPHTVIYGHGGVEIGENTLIAMGCSILSSDHTVPGRNVLIRDQPDVKSPTVIGRDVWLGAGVRVLRGTRIGDGAVIGAGAVVTRDIPSYAIAIGVPARVVRHRE